MSPRQNTFVSRVAGSLQKAVTSVLPKNSKLEKKEKTESPKIKEILAVVDIGAHSVNLLIAQVDDQGDYDVIENLSHLIPLGAEVFSTGMIRNRTIRVLCSIMSKFKIKMEEYGVDRHIVIATSAVREAENAEVLIERVTHSCGLNVTIFDSSDNARLEDIITKRFLPDYINFSEKQSLVCYIGTGSLQLSHYGGDKLGASTSLKVGTLRLSDKISSLMDHGARQFSASFHVPNLVGADAFCEFLSCDYLIASGASVRLVLDGINTLMGTDYHDGLSKEQFKTFFATIMDTPIDELMDSLEEKSSEADALLPCCFIINHLFEVSGAQELIIPSGSTSHLVLIDLINKSRGVNTFNEQIDNAVIHLAKKYNCWNDYSKLSVALAERLFDLLEEEHGLSSRNKQLLKVAASLHRCGYMVSNQGMHKHSYYLIKSSEIPGLNEHERIVSALIARYHRKAEPRQTHPEFMDVTHHERSIVRKLAAIIRAAVTLASFSVRPEQVNLDIGDSKVVLKVANMSVLLPAARASLNDSFSLFRDVYNKKVIIS